MLLLLVLLITSYWILTFLTHQVNLRLSAVSMLLFHHTRPAVIIYTLLLLPGTLVHELSHALTALVMQVRVGQIDLFPRFDKKTHQVKLGSVQIAKTDFIRDSLIGIAPTILGSLLIIFILTYFIFPNPLSFNFFNLQQINSQPFMSFLLLYLVFSISSTLQTSQSDRRSLPLLIITFAFLALFFYFVTGISTVPLQLVDKLIQLTNLLIFAFIFSSLLNLIFLLPLLILQKILEITTQKQIVLTKKL